MQFLFDDAWVVAALDRHHAFDHDGFVHLLFAGPTRQAIAKRADDNVGNQRTVERGEQRDRHTGADG